MKTVRFDSASLPESVLNACGQVVRAFFPGVRFVGDGDVCICLEACFSEEFESESVSCGNPHSCPRAMYATLHTLSVSRLSFHVSHNLTGDEIAALWRLGLSWDREPGEESLLRIAAQRVVLGLMEKVTGRVMPWGILTGVRPGRLWHELTVAGLAPEARRGILARLYGVAEAKIDLLQDVGAAQEAVLRAWQDDCHVAVYVSIPFCPSRCSYCAFPGFPARRAEMAAYLGVLGDEIGLLAQDLETYGLRINAVYIGGGTPTALETGLLERLLESLTGLLPMAGAAEFCCEAGRPETLTADKLAVLAAAGVTRLCINPQTLDDGTLRRIGRSHSAGDFYRALELARRTASWHINADMILGLPGEGEGHAEKTIKGLVELAIDSVTVHYLTLKRGAALGSERREVGDGRDHGVRAGAGLDENVNGAGGAAAGGDTGVARVDGWLDDSVLARIGENVRRELVGSGYQPYYLYRQKGMVGNLENVGYALPGAQSLYNIVMIAESQHVVGLGAGAASKIRLGDTHKNLFHAKDVASYGKRMPEIVEKRRWFWQ